MITRGEAGGKSYATGEKYVPLPLALRATLFPPVERVM